MTSQLQQLRQSLTEMRDAFEKAPPECDDFQLAAHYAGLVIKAVPAIDSAIETLSAEIERLSKVDAAALTTALTDAESMAYAQFLKRVSWREYRENAVNEAEAYVMRDAGDKIRTALADAGYEPR